MTLRETAITGVQKLIDVYTQAPEGRKKKVDVLHDGFEHLPKETRQLIEDVLREVYRGDFEIVRKAFVEKLEFFLRLIADALEEAECVDTELQEKIGATREQIANVVNQTEVSEEDVRWLRRIGFLPVDIFELTAKLDISGVIAELRENIDEYKLILGDEKYIVKILKMYEGLDKLKRLRSFYGNYDKDIVEFNGYHLAQIVLGAGWEEKLKYFEDPENLKLLTDAGFNGSHLAQIVVNASWEEKLKYFEDPENLKRLTDAGFNGYHLAQIVLGASWEEKLKLVSTEACLGLLRENKLTHNALAKLLKRKNWRKQLQDLEVSL